MSKKKLKMRRNNKNTAGFTLIEMIITISIMGILAAIAIISMSPTKNASQVEAAQKEVASEIALAKAYALQGKTQNISGAPTTPCGYGVRFSSTTKYFIYYNYNSSIDCETYNTDPANRQFKSSKLGEKTLASGITGTSGADVYFTVPNAQVYNAGYSTGSVTIILTNGTISKEVSVNSAGLITAEE
jgi:prepilin-type N-terminal cleavage/methylation domain-containing protein